MEQNELQDRIERLEAEAIVLRKYVETLVSMLPNTLLINGALAEATRSLNTRPSSPGGPDSTKIQAVTMAMNLVSRRRLEYLASR